jgi:hypothetical protein
METRFDAAMVSTVMMRVCLEQGTGAAYACCVLSHCIPDYEASDDSCCACL